jgi:hypothetical protein
MVEVEESGGSLGQLYSVSEGACACARYSWA